MTDTDVYAALGDDGFTRLVAAFYRRVRADDRIGPLYPSDEFEAAEQRLRGFLVQRFGGPATYSQTRGHPRLRMRHAPFPIDTAARDRWLGLMRAAVAEVALPTDITAVLWPYFVDTATHMVNR